MLLRQGTYGMLMNGQLANKFFRIGIDAVMGLW